MDGSTRATENAALLSAFEIGGLAPLCRGDSLVKLKKGEDGKVEMSPFIEKAALQDMKHPLLR